MYISEGRGCLLKVLHLRGVGGALNQGRALNGGQMLIEEILYPLFVNCVLVLLSRSIFISVARLCLASRQYFLLSHPHAYRSIHYSFTSLQVAPTGKVYGIDHIEQLVVDATADMKRGNPELLSEKKVELIGMWMSLCSQLA